MVSSIAYYNGVHTTQYFTAVHNCLLWCTMLCCVILHSINYEFKEYQFKVVLQCILL